MCFEIMPDVEFPTDPGFDRDRFGRLFEQAQRAIPEADRALIFAFWFGVRFSAHPRKHAPDVRLAPGSHGGAAAEMTEGFELTISLLHFQKMPEDLFVTAIVHELAHVLQHAVGFNWGQHTRAQAEADADARVTSWGRDMATARAWVDSF